MLGCHLTVFPTEENIVYVFCILYDEGGESKGSEDDGGGGHDSDGGGDSIVSVVVVVILSVRIVVVMVIAVMGKVCMTKSSVLLLFANTQKTRCIIYVREWLQRDQ